MKTKYIFNGGLAFSEKRDVKKLERYAADGWLFKDFALGGFMYKLIEAPKQELSYTIDFQSYPENDYLDIFSQAGWKHITSYHKQIHIFSAPKGTPPIYSGNEINEGKYKEFTTKLGKGALYSFLNLVFFSVLANMGQYNNALIYNSLVVISMICSVFFLFNFIPYLKYKYNEKINKLKANQ